MNGKVLLKIRMMKPFRLIVHQKTFSGNSKLFFKVQQLKLVIIVESDLIINPKDFPGAKQGDVVEIYHPYPDEENPRLLLQITTFKDDLQARGNYFISLNMF